MSLLLVISFISRLWLFEGLSWIPGVVRFLLSGCIITTSVSPSFAHCLQQVISVKPLTLYSARIPLVQEPLLNVHTNFCDLFSLHHPLFSYPLLQILATSMAQNSDLCSLNLLRPMFCLGFASLFFVRNVLQNRNLGILWVWSCGSLFVLSFSQRSQFFTTYCSTPRHYFLTVFSSVLKSLQLGGQVCYQLIFHGWKQRRLNFYFQRYTSF